MKKMKTHLNMIQTQIQIVSKLFPAVNEVLQIQIIGKIQNLSAMSRTKYLCRSIMRKQKYMLGTIAFVGNQNSPTNQVRLLTVIQFEVYQC